MANWIECRPYKNPDSKIWVNLDHVAKIVGGLEGSTFTLASGEEIVVENLVGYILKSEKVRAIA